MSRSKSNKTQSDSTLADINVGILGGGQLARMLALRGFELGAEVHIYSEHTMDPAAQVTRYWHQGELESENDLRTFLKDVKVATFESEFMNAELLQRLSLEVGTKIFPQPTLMGNIQDRLSQKELLLKHKLPTAEFRRVDSIEELNQAFEELGPLVLKKRRFGYDGYGTFVIKTKDSIAKLAEKVEAESFGFIAERFVKFKREIACVIVRSQDGSVAELPFVESFQADSRCLWVKGPLKSSTQLLKLRSSLIKFLKSIDYVGAMGFEFFETSSGILINELAPRVHNSAHYSMNALSEDQFSLHMKAIMGAKISSPTLSAKGFAMYNLLGSSNDLSRWTEIPKDVALHWYGKKANRPGRKMGHLNAVGHIPEAALKKLKSARKKFEI